MNIGEIFENAPNLEVKGIMTDSRKPCEDGIFFCIRGLVNDGHDFISQAVENGAICIVHSEEVTDIIKGVTYLKVDNTMEALNIFTAAFYGNVTKKMKVYGVTGTNGKSTIAWITRNLVNHFVKCGYIGTIGIVKEKDELLPTPLTTPDTVYLHKTCKEMYDVGCRAVSMEVSSIGLEEHRVDSVDYDFIAFTNLTHDHLDYHGDFENYYRAKRRLFTMVGKDKTAIINIDDEYGERLFEETTATPVSIAINKPADYRAVNITLMEHSTTFDIVYNNESHHVKTNLVAMFNVYNLLTVVAMLHEDGYTFETLIPLLENIPQVLGRMEVVNEGQNFNVIVDYAHTPDGFYKVFDYADAITPTDKKIICVFGCAGSRDTKKRSELGAIADIYCKTIIITSEDPRNDNPEDIYQQIKSGITRNVSMFVEDRYSAIRQAIELANSGDTVLILGKGDEEYQDIKGTKEYWMGDERAASQILNNLLREEEETDGN